jgi:hypothetical protein
VVDLVEVPLRVFQAFGLQLSDALAAVLHTADQTRVGERFEVLFVQRDLLPTGAIATVPSSAIVRPTRSS